jgi:hypothetical protein
MYFARCSIALIKLSKEAFTPFPITQGVAMRCRLSLLTNSALESYAGDGGGGGGCGVSANECSCAHHDMEPK